jgi:hypothetical protein
MALLRVPSALETEANSFHLREVTIASAPAVTF